MPCGRCGRHFQSCIDNFQNCPAFTQSCLRCGRRGHYAVCCNTRAVPFTSQRGYQINANQFRSNNMQPRGAFVRRNFPSQNVGNQNRFQHMNQNNNQRYGAQNLATAFNQPLDSPFAQNRNMVYNPRRFNQNNQRGYVRNNIFVPRVNRFQTNNGPNNMY